MAQNAPRDEKWLLRHLSDLDRRVGSLETAPRAGHTAVAAGGVIVQNGGGVFVYDGDPALGNLIVSLASADGTDAYGNAYTRGLWIAGYEVGGFSNQIVLQPPSPAGTDIVNAEIFAQVDGSNAAELFLIGPSDGNVGTSFAYVSIRGANQADGDTAIITLDCNETQVSGDLSVAGILSGSSIAGEVPVTFSSKTVFTQSVTFPNAFATVPAVTTNIRSGAGVTAGWISRASGVTTTGFTLFLEATSGSAVSWSGIPVQWQAIGT